jgi:DNA mismatch endonuclease (patch repair protein)
MDKLNKADRSENMRRIRSKNSKPEMLVRKILRSLGYSGYRLHRHDLAGRPDIVFTGRKKAIFVNGCFWHGHSCKEGLRKPQSNIAYWSSKIQGNQARDQENLLLLNQLGWQTLTLWECELKDSQTIESKLRKFMS